jgi:cytochrome c oxidase assembly factor 1
MRQPVTSLSRLLRPLWRSGGQGAFRRPSPPSIRTIVAAPRPNSGPLLSRRADRELPSVVSQRRWLRSIPVFAVIVVGAALGIFNYQRLSSSVVSSTMFALRRSPSAREALGDEIQFAYRIPWISGEVNQLHGRIDISFWVKGTRATGKMRFKSTRESRLGFVS